MIVQIYKLIDPITNKLRYIGRTKNTLNRRLAGHIYKSKNKSTHKDCWIQCLISKGYRPIIEFICNVDGWTESYKYEQNLINKLILEGYDLVNTDDRGEGGINKVISEKQKNKISISVKKLHEDGKLSCNRKAVEVYDLNGNFIKEFISIKSCSVWLKKNSKQLEGSLQRRAKRFNKYQIIYKGNKKPGVYNSLKPNPKMFKKLILINIIDNTELIFNSRKDFKKHFNTGSSTVNYYLNKDKVYLQKYKIIDARIKQGELLENPTLERQKEDNQQPSLTSNSFEGSTTNSRVLIDNTMDSNANTSALPFIIEKDKDGKPLMSLSWTTIDFSKIKGDDIV